MTTKTGREAEPLALLTHLIELDFDTIDVYEAAIRRLEDPEVRSTLQEFKEDHLRHVENLIAVVYELGGIAPQHSDLRGVFETGKVMLANLVGERAILKALKNNEADSITAYGRAAGRPELSPHIHELVATGLEDEHRHHAWLDSKIRTL